LGYKEVPFQTMLRSDGKMICEHWLLINSVGRYGVNLGKPMMFNEFLKQIGTYLTPMNCKSVLQQARWYIADDEI